MPSKNASRSVFSSACDAPGGAIAWGFSAGALEAFFWAACARGDCAIAGNDVHTATTIKILQARLITPPKLKWIGTESSGYRQAIQLKQLDCWSFRIQF